MDKWKKMFLQSVTETKDLGKKLKIDSGQVDQTIGRYPMRINPYYFSLIKSKGDPIWKQSVPDIEEIVDRKGESDPLNEEKYTPLFGVVHRYPDRVLLLVSNLCAMYCRFCTRKRKVGKRYDTISDRDFKKAIRYIKTHKKVRDVIISGGDPLLLEDKKIELYLKELKKIKHVEIVRIDSRTPCTLPQRITPKLCKMLKKYQPLYFLTHFNHPREITKEAIAACKLLTDHGIQMGNQSVMLKGVNDNPRSLIELNDKLLEILVRPYYIYIPDAVEGSHHFRVSVDAALKIMKKVIGHTSGLAIPKLILDIENGGGKIPLSPNYLIKRKGKKYILNNFEGKKFLHMDV